MLVLDDHAVALQLHFAGNLFPTATQITGLNPDSFCFSGRTISPLAYNYQIAGLLLAIPLYQNESIGVTVNSLTMRRWLVNWIYAVLFFDHFKK